jgi:hypothetical protein
MAAEAEAGAASTTAAIHGSKATSSSRAADGVGLAAVAMTGTTTGMGIAGMSIRARPGLLVEATARHPGAATVNRPMGGAAVATAAAGAKTTSDGRLGPVLPMSGSQDFKPRLPGRH